MLQDSLWHGTIKKHYVYTHWLKGGTWEKMSSNGSRNPCTVPYGKLQENLIELHSIVGNFVDFFIRLRLISKVC